MQASSPGADLARRFIDALHALEQQGDRAIDPMAALFADDATIANAALDLRGGERRGGRNVRTFWSEYVRSLHGAATEFHAVTHGPDAIGLFWTTRVTGQGGSGASGATSVEGATLLRLAGDGSRIVAMRGYYDTRALSGA